jgi:hypothetical protein
MDRSLYCQEFLSYIYNEQKTTRMDNHKETDQGNESAKEGSEIHNPERDKATNNSEEDFEILKKYLQNWPKSEVIQALILIVGTVYCIVTIGLWCAAGHANKIAAKGVADADRNFRRDERAWVAFEFTGEKLTVTLNKPFLVPTKLINVGKTPAKKVEGEIVVAVFKKGEPLSFDYTPGNRNWHYEIHAGAIFPNGSITESFEGRRHGIDKSEAELITKPILDDIGAARSFIIVHGIITYWDIFGTEHRTTYCRYVTGPNLISDQCTRYNDTDDN